MDLDDEEGVLQSQTNYSENESFLRYLENSRDDNSLDFEALNDNLDYADLRRVVSDPLPSSQNIVINVEPPNVQNDQPPNNDNNRPELIDINVVNRENPFKSTFKLRDAEINRKRVQAEELLYNVDQANMLAGEKFRRDKWAMKNEELDNKRLQYYRELGELESKKPNYFDDRYVMSNFKFRDEKPDATPDGLTIIERRSKIAYKHESFMLRNMEARMKAIEREDADKKDEVDPMVLADLDNNKLNQFPVRRRWVKQPRNRVKRNGLPIDDVEFLRVKPGDLRFNEDQYN